MALEIFLEALEADVAWCADDQDAEEGLYVSAESLFLSEKQQNGFDKRPQ